MREQRGSRLAAFSDLQRIAVNPYRLAAAVQVKQRSGVRLRRDLRGVAARFHGGTGVDRQA